MILDLIVHKTDDGYTAEVPSLKGCEAWAHDEDTVLDKILDLTVFYLKLSSKEKLKMDKAHGSRTRTVYKLIFNKND